MGAKSILCILSCPTRARRVTSDTLNCEVCIILYCITHTCVPGMYFLRYDTINLLLPSDQTSWWNSHIKKSSKTSKTYFVLLFRGGGGGGFGSAVQDHPTPARLRPVTASGGAGTKGAEPKKKKKRGCCYWFCRCCCPCPRLDHNGSTQVAPGDDEDRADARALTNQIKNLTGLWDSDPEEVIPLPLVVVRRLGPPLSYYSSLQYKFTSLVARVV